MATNEYEDGISAGAGPWLGLGVGLITLLVAIAAMVWL